MKYTATRNKYKDYQNVSDKNKPDFNLYMKDGNGEMIQEEYTKKDGTKGMGWKKFGVIWINLDEMNKIKSMNVQIEDDQPQAQPQSQAQNNEVKEELSPEDIPF